MAQVAPYNFDELARFHHDLCFGAIGFYTRNCLKIRIKSQGLKPLILNRAQRFLHEIIERQKREIGRVRVIVLKGRQQGMSTYTQARFFRFVTTIEGIQAFILTHEQEATNNLFGMAERFYENAPDLVKPELGACNAKELTFKHLDSGYRVGTASNKGVGRSQTIHLFHGSEVGLWKNPEEHLKGIFQAVSDADGTEIILESTAQGFNNLFHDIWKSAERQETDFIPVFIPWFWQEEYAKPVPDDFVLQDDEHEIADLYGLTNEQIYWRRFKILDFAKGDLAAGLLAFKQEYPLNAAEAFQYTGGDTLITATDCIRARKRTVQGSGPLIVGVDPSYGGDRFALVRRWGCKMYGNEAYRGRDVEQFSQRLNLCLNILQTVDPVAGKVPDYMVLDAAVGLDIAQELSRLGYGEKVYPVHFATKVKDKRYPNIRQQMYARFVDALRDETYLMELPDDDEFQADLCATPYEYNTSSEVKLLVSKKVIKKEFGFSPDYADAAGLTFAIRPNVTAFDTDYIPRPVPILSTR